MNLRKFGAEALRPTIKPLEEKYPTGDLKIESVEIKNIKKGFAVGKEKVLIVVSDSTGKKWNYWPNGSSLNIIMDMFGEEHEKLVGKTISLTLSDVDIGGVPKKCITVVDQKGGD